jgi:hypothetical protein
LLFSVINRSTRIYLAENPRKATIRQAVKKPLFY